jgi:hypothetical protein
MYAKSGLSIIAAAGVAFGVVGMTMGGASSAPAPYCAPATSAGASDSGSGDNATSNAKASNADASNADASANGAGTEGAGTNGTGPLGPVGPDGNGATDPDGSGPTGPTGPAGGDGSNGSNGSGGSLIEIDADTTTGSDAAPAPTTPATQHGSDHFLDLRGNTDSVDAADPVIVPPSASHVVGRSQPIGRLLHVDGVANLGR